MCVAEVRGVIVGVVWDTCGTVVLWYCGTVYAENVGRERECVFVLMW